MIYESANPNFGITTDRGHIQFLPVTDPITKIVYGQFDTEATRHHKALGLTAVQLSQEIESASAFKRHAAGEFGVWPASERMSQQEHDIATGAITSAMAHLDEATLKAIITGKGQEIPIKASKEELVRLATELSLPDAPKLNAKTGGKARGGKKKVADTDSGDETNASE